MFGFLKDKLKTALHKFSKDVEKDAETTAVKKEKDAEEITEAEQIQNVKLSETVQPEVVVITKAPVASITAKTEKVVEQEAGNAKSIQEKVKDSTKEKHRELQSQETSKRKETESKKESHIKFTKEDSEKHTQYITIDSTNKQNQDNVKIEIEDEDFKEEFAEKKGFFSKLKEKFTKKKEEDKKTIEELAPKEEVKEKQIIQEVKEEIQTEQIREGKTETKKQEKVAEPEQSKGFFSKLTDTITKTNLSDEKFNEIFWELEIILMENNVAVEVIDKMRDDLKKELVDIKVKRGTVEEIISETLKKTVNDLFDVEKIEFLSKVKTKKPFVIAFFGINGSGKTTTIAKIAYLLKKNNLSCVIAAGDTFRAAAIQQMEEHTQKLNIRLIKQDYGADPAAVAFDAIKYAEAKSIDVVLVDTAGRMHSNTNLMDEMKKIIRVAKPDLKVFIGEAITGNDCVEQAKEFNAAVGIDAIILCKADVDDKGGAALSISYVTKKPILFLGVGQNYQDLQEFDKKVIIESLSV
ncbi:signal recognition particle-docking protein FtsY [Candidatus Woesearchaeota archaeon]|nr:signal recognition particle-docking protein FtsY [Candidatus Woesearchaeota archaeon]